MLRVLVYAFAAATLGGLDSPKGALVGGLIIGLSQTLIPAYVPFIGFELSVLPSSTGDGSHFADRPASCTEPNG